MILHEVVGGMHTMPKKGANLGVSSLPESAILCRCGEEVGFEDRCRGVMVKVCQGDTGLFVGIPPEQVSAEDDLDLKASGRRYSSSFVSQGRKNKVQDVDCGIPSSLLGVGRLDIKDVRMHESSLGCGWSE